MAVDAEVFILIALFLSFFCACRMKMVMANMFNSMMNSLNCRQLTSKAILQHTIGGISAGAASNRLFTLITPIPGCSPGGVHPARRSFMEARAAVNQAGRIP